MAVFTIPTSFGDDPQTNYIIEVSLDDVVFKIRFTYNSRQSTWYFNLLDSSDTVIRCGIATVSEWPLLYHYVGEERPAGNLVAMPVAGTIDKATLKQLGKEVLFTYSGES